MRKLLFIVILTITFSKMAFATVDILYVNHLTREYQYSDNGCSGWIGWSSIKVDGSVYDKEETRLINEGYTKMTFSYKIELVILVLMVLITIVSLRLKKKLSKF